MTYLVLCTSLRTPLPSYPAIDFWERALHVNWMFLCAALVCDGCGSTVRLDGDGGGGGGTAGTKEKRSAQNAPETSYDAPGT